MGWEGFGGSGHDKAGLLGGHCAQRPCQKHSVTFCDGNYRQNSVVGAIKASLTVGAPRSTQCPLSRSDAQGCCRCTLVSHRCSTMSFPHPCKHSISCAWQTIMRFQPGAHSKMRLSQCCRLADTLLRNQASCRTDTDQQPSRRGSSGHIVLRDHARNTRYLPRLMHPSTSACLPYTGLSLDRSRIRITSETGRGAPKDEV